MNILAINAERTELQYLYFASGQTSVHQPNQADFDGSAQRAQELFDKELEEALTTNSPGSTTVPVAIHVRYGGQHFTSPVVAGDDELETLRNMVPHAPLHLPRIINLVEAIEHSRAWGPAVLTFATAFFTQLPERETSYGLDPESSNKLGIHRHGFHGLYHQMACDHVRLSNGGSVNSNSARLLSVCLEPKPEVCAVMGQRPLTVTGGATPLEGIPGETSCGEIDPSIVLALSDHQQWGPEHVNQLLTQESGMKGLIGRRTNLSEVFTSDTPAYRQARRILEYRIQLACGAGIAAMGGIDALVFSGRYADAGEVVGPRLRERLLPALPHRSTISWHIHRQSLLHIVAQIGRTFVPREAG